MATSQEVFALRKSGSLDEAYSLALTVIKDDPDDEWNIKAIAWCLYDLIKRSVSQNDYQKAKLYVSQLEKYEIDESDEILFKSVEHAKVLATPEKRIILQAKEKSKQGNHQEALPLFRQAIQLFPNDIDLNTQFAWELQKEGKLIFEKEKIDVQLARQLLAEYIKLKNPRPSQLHSIFLRYADKIIDREEFNLISFLKLWDLQNLRSEDFEKFTKEDKAYPSIAEKVIQHGAKLILDKKLTNEVGYFIPIIDLGINHFPDNIWLAYYKAKLLRMINRNEEAIDFLIPVVKEKIGDYWTWSLLAELIIDKDREIALSCFCKSLLCSGEEKFLANVRQKLSELLIQLSYLDEAKVEIDIIVRVKEQEGVKVSDSLKNYRESAWYKNALAKKSNTEFYHRHKKLAEEFVFNSLPWLDGCLGKTFTIPEKPDKPKRKLYIKNSEEIIEVAVSDRKFGTSNGYKIGEAIRVKGEYDRDKVFQIYLLERRESERFDLFDEHNGNLVQLLAGQSAKSSSFRIAAAVGGKIKEGIIDQVSVVEDFSLNEGMPLFVKYFQKIVKKPSYIFSTPKESKVEILNIRYRPTGKSWDCFPEHVGIIDHINVEKGIAHFIISKDINSTIRLSQLNHQVKVGSRVLVKVKRIVNDRESYYTVLTAEVTEQEASPNLVKSFRGAIEMSGSVGFADDVYIESALINEFKIGSDDIVEGTAILNYNKKRLKWGWKAIGITNVEKSLQQDIDEDDEGSDYYQ